MTELGYLSTLEAAYVRSFRARIVARPPGAIVLDRTWFYPAGGGQPSDRGQLASDGGGRWRVVDVVRSGPTVLHRLARTDRAPLPEVGAELAGEIDWDRRYRHMRSHTAQHLLSARAFALSGRRTVRAVFDAERGTIELEGPGGAELALPALEADLRSWIRPGRPVTLRFERRADYDRDPAPRSGLVPLAPQVDPVRLVEIERADRCPCGGTHVRSTEEIGEVSLSGLRELPGGQCAITFVLGAAASTTLGA